MVAFGGLSIELSVLSLLLVLRCFGPWDYHLSVAYCLQSCTHPNTDYPSHTANLISNQLFLTATKSTTFSLFGSIWDGHHIWPGSFLTWCGHHFGWLPWVDIEYLLLPFRLLVDKFTPHCSLEFCCKILPLLEMTSSVLSYSEMIDYRQKSHSY